MNCVVTGGAGFIGSHLSELLCKLGHEVRVIDNLSIGKKTNLDSFINKIDFYNLDISKDDLTKPFQNVDWVFHLAALADIVPSINFPINYMETNVTGTVKVLEYARSAGAKRIIYAASSSCYGIPSHYPTNEESFISPEYPYALSKYLGEQTFLHWLKVYSLSGVSLRLFNVFGPRARTSGTYGAVMGVFIAQAKNNKPLTIVGDGKQKRDFVFVYDVAEAFYRAAKSQIQSEIINIGCSNPIEISYLADLISSNQVFIPKRPGEPEQTFADINKASSLLGWVPKYSFEDGLKITLADEDSWKNAPVWTVESIAEATSDWFKYMDKF